MTILCQFRTGNLYPLTFIVNEGSIKTEQRVIEFMVTKNRATFNKYELGQFRSLQRLAYQCVQEVANALKVGDTEKKAVSMMTAWMAERGVKHYFHKPFAWFGDRTAFHRFWNPTQFFPTGRRLVEGMPVILDIAPVFDGYVADIGYSFSFGVDTVLHKRVRRDLLDYRTLILQCVKSEMSFKEIYRAVDRRIEEHGYKRVHSRYPFRVLAHQVTRVSNDRLSALTLGRFGLGGLKSLAKQARISQFIYGGDDRSPFWNDRVESDHKPIAGLWAVEPHIGCRAVGEDRLDGKSKVVGAKWEELLVITESDAYWLDESVPHNSAVEETKEQPSLTHLSV